MSVPAQRPQIRFYSPYFGCDPELFFTKEGGVIGAEKVIPETGLAYKTIVLDGVQVELNPNPNYCRALLANAISASFRTLRTHLAGMKDISVSFRSVIELDKKELDSLSEKSKALGCAPSMNVYDSKASVRVDGATYLKRSAGGHIHLGTTTLQPYAKELVQLLDVLVGNTCVLIDRDPEAPERRKVYGRAGEHRIPLHGVEYRTLSNFWLRAPELMSFVMGMSRLACSVLYTEKRRDEWKWPATSELLALIDLKAIEDAINRNDLELAKANFNIVKSFLNEHASFPYYSLGKEGLPLFDFFTQMLQEKGLEYWFPKDPMTAWCATDDHHGHGWESFLANSVALKAKELKRRQQDETDETDETTLRLYNK